MKKIIIVVLTIIVIIQTIVIINLTKYDNKDVNRDGKVSSKDFAIIKSYLLNKEASNE